MRALYDSKSKSIDDRGIGNLLSEKNRLETWLKVEGVLQSQAERDISRIRRLRRSGTCALRIWIWSRWPGSRQRSAMVLFLS